MKNGALGLIETYGYVGAIEAADTAIKAAYVKLVGVEKVKGGLVTVHITGDVGAVKAAVEAGAQSCKRMGVLISAHVIPRPGEDVYGILPRPVRQEDVTLSPVPTQQETRLREDQPDHQRQKQENPSLQDFGLMKVVDLRNYVRKLEHFPIPNKKIKYANKKQLMDALRVYYTKENK